LQDLQSLWGSYYECDGAGTFSGPIQRDLIAKWEQFFVFPNVEEASFEQNPPAEDEVPLHMD
jgi:hypothetical protein